MGSNLIWLATLIDRDTEKAATSQGERLGKNQPCLYSHFGLSVSRTVRKQNFYCLNYPRGGIAAP